MKHANHASRPSHAARPTRRAKSKAPALLVSLALVLLVGVGATVAYIATATEPVNNAFQPRKVEVSISETVTETTKSDIVFKNEVDIPVFVRATLAIYWTDAQGNVVSQPEGCSVAVGAAKAGWTKVGDVYYYNEALAPAGQEGYSTTAMLEPSVANVAKNSEYKLNVDVLYEAIQAQPATTVQDAWKVTIANGAVTPVAGE